MGDAYAYSWGMTNPAFVASFAHPEKLELMPEWGEDVRVVFKVYTTDGAVRFLPATGEGPEFSAAVDGTLHTSVTRAEALFSPAWPRDHYDETLGYFCMEVSSEEAEKDYDALLSAYNEANGLTGEDALTREKVKEQLDGAASEQSWKAVFDGENVTYTGAFAGESPDGEALAESLSLLSDAGVRLMEAESGSAKPSIEIDADASVQTLNEQSGDTGTVLALGDSALTMAQSKAAGPLGVIDGILDPKGTATRAEVAQIVMNYGAKRS